MEKQSLRAIAKELGVSHSYLSQVIHGKRPASEKVLTTSLIKSDFSQFKCYNPNVIAELCSGSTGDFGSSSPGSNPGSAANSFG